MKPEGWKIYGLQERLQPAPSSAREGRLWLAWLAPADLSKKQAMAAPTIAINSIVERCVW